MFEYNGVIFEAHGDSVVLTVKDSDADNATVVRTVTLPQGVLAQVAEVLISDMDKESSGTKEKGPEERLLDIFEERLLEMSEEDQAQAIASIEALLVPSSDRDDGDDSDEGDSKKKGKSKRNKKE